MSLIADVDRFAEPPNVQYVSDIMPEQTVVDFATNRVDHEPAFTNLTPSRFQEAESCSRDTLQ